MFADRPPGSAPGPNAATDADTAPLLPFDDPDVPGSLAEDETAILPVIDDEPPPPPPAERRRRMLLTVLGVVAVLGIAAGIDIGLAGNGGQHHAAPPPALTSPTQSPSAPATTAAAPPPSSKASSTPTAKPTKPTANPSAAVIAKQRAQARAVTALIARSAAARAGIGGAISSIGACKAIPAAVRTLDGAAAARAGVAADLARTPVDALPGHDRLVADLTAALSASAGADRHYAAWGRAVAPHCGKRARHTADYTAAQHDDAAATAAKQRFAGEWNPLATRLGVPVADPNRF